VLISQSDKEGLYHLTLVPVVSQASLHFLFGSQKLVVSMIADEPEEPTTTAFVSYRPTWPAHLRAINPENNNQGDLFYWLDPSLSDQTWYTISLPAVVLEMQED
jgi:hypothetical protein